MTATVPTDTVTIILRGYFSRQLPLGGKPVAIPWSEATTVRSALARLSVPLGAVGLILVNKQQADIDAPLHPGDMLDVLPLLGGGFAG